MVQDPGHSNSKHTNNQLHLVVYHALLTTTSVAADESRVVKSHSHQLVPLAPAVTTFIVDEAVLPDLQKTEEASGIRRQNPANGHHACQLIKYSQCYKNISLTNLIQEVAY